MGRPRTRSRTQRGSSASRNSLLLASALLFACTAAPEPQAAPPAPPPTAPAPPPPPPPPPPSASAPASQAPDPCQGAHIDATAAFGACRCDAQGKPSAAPIPPGLPPPATGRRECAYDASDAAAAAKLIGTIEPPGPVKSGEAARLVVRIKNPSDAPVRVTLRSLGMVITLRDDKNRIVDVEGSCGDNFVIAAVPKRPPEDSVYSDGSAANVVVAPGGEIVREVEWNANKRKFRLPPGPEFVCTTQRGAALAPGRYTLVLESSYVRNLWSENIRGPVEVVP